MANKVLIDRAVVQQALEALQTELMGYDGPVPHIDSAITALRAALAQAEPVHAVLAEREACARLCEELDAMAWSNFGEYSSGYAHDIRARGEK